MFLLFFQEPVFQQESLCDLCMETLAIRLFVDHGLIFLK